MACGACGSKRSNVEYLVTLRDGSERRVATAGEARIIARGDVTVGSKSPTIKPVPKIA